MATNITSTEEHGWDVIDTEERERAAYLLDAQTKAVRLFEEIK